MVIDLPSIAAIAAAGVTLIAAVGAAWVSIITASRQAKTDLKIDNVAQKTAQIETSVNSEKTAALGREKALADQNQILRDQIEDHKRTAALLAQAVAIQGQAPASVSIPAEKSLSNIDVQTKAIETNTAKTDAAVQDLKSTRDKRIADAEAALEEARKS